MAIKPIQILINAKDEASGVFDKLQNKIAAVGAAVLGYFGVKAFSGAVTGAADLEQAMSRVQAATGATGDELVKLKEAAEAAGDSTKFTAAEGAAALENLAKAGLSSADAIATLPPVMQLAQAGDIELARSSEILTKVVMGMGLEFQEAGRAADVLALGANATNSSVDGLAEALSYTAPAAKSLGVSLESTTAILGKMADAGIDASRAGTSLNNILSQFADPLSSFRKELSAAGITTTDFEKALHQLAKSGANGEKAINSVGLNAGPALRALLNQGMGALDELTEKLRNAQGSAAETAAVMENNLKGSLNGLSSAWDTLTNALTTPLLPILRDGVEQLSGSLRKAVSDGTIAKFGEAIASMFRAGIEWASKFAGSFDWTAIAGRMEEFAGKAKTTFDDIGNWAKNAGNVVQTAWGVMSAGANAVLTGIYGIGIAFASTAAGIVKAAATMSEGLAKIAITESAKKKLLDDAAQMREALAGLNGVSEEFGRRANASLELVANGAQLTRDAWGRLTGGIKDASIAAGDAAPQISAVAKALQDAAEANAKATEQNKKAALQQQELAEKAEKAKVAVAGLKAQYEQALENKDWQRAAELQVQLKAAVESTTRSLAQQKKEADDAAKAVAAAFAQAGIQTKAQLEQDAKTARAQFDLIKQSGLATAEGVSEAWKRAAEAAIKANNGIAPGWVQAEASARGYSIEVDNAGKASIKTADVATSATGKIVVGWHGVRQAVRDAADSLTDFERRSNAISAAGVRGSEEYKKKWGVDGNNMSVDSSGQRIGGMEQEFQVNQRVAALFGEDMIDNENARKAANLMMQTDLARKYGILNEKSNLKYYDDLQRELTRLSNLVLQERADKAANSNAAKTPTSNDSGSGRSGSATSYVSNITLDGTTSTVNFADQSSQQTMEELLRRLTQARRSAS